MQYLIFINYLFFPFVYILADSFNATGICNLVIEDNHQSTEARTLAQYLLTSKMFPFAVVCLCNSALCCPKIILATHTIALLYKTVLPFSKERSGEK